jgi:O-methyltransferase involved in polyketide biosynthesis
MIDVLHYLDADDQQRMLFRLAEAAEEGSLILIRTALRGTGWRYTATLIEEWWTRATGWIRGGQINFPTREEILGVFEDRGLRAEISPLWGKTPFASYLVKIHPRAKSAAQPRRRAA